MLSVADPITAYAILAGVSGLLPANPSARWDDEASPEAALFEPRLRAALAYMDAMTRSVTVPDAVFAALKPHYEERQIVELTMLVAAYNMLTRVLTALEADFEPLPPKKG